MALLHGSVGTLLLFLIGLPLLALAVPSLVLWLLPGLSARTKWIAFALMVGALVATWVAVALTDGAVPEMAVLLAPATVGLALGLRGFHTPSRHL